MTASPDAAGSGRKRRPGRDEVAVPSRAGDPELWLYEYLTPYGYYVGRVRGTDRLETGWLLSVLPALGGDWREDEVLWDADQERIASWFSIGPLNSYIWSENHLSLWLTTCWLRRPGCTTAANPAGIGLCEPCRDALDDEQRRIEAGYADALIADVGALIGGGKR